MATLSNEVKSRYTRDDIIIGIAVIVLVAACYAALYAKGVSGLRLGAIANNVALYLSTFCIVIGTTGLLHLKRHRPISPIRFIIEYYKLNVFAKISRENLLIFAPLLIFMPTFSAMKSSIPLFHPYTWDNFLIESDRFIFGTDAWRLLHPVLGFPIITSSLSIIYHLWILLIYAGCLYFAIWESNYYLRRRFFVTYFSAWVVCGIILAICFSSVGPCFVAPLLGNGHFASLMTYLNDANNVYPVMVLDVQNELIRWKTIGDHGLGRGISAMPSMHVSLAFLYFLALRKKSRTLSRAFGTFFVLILLGSIHLAYHYAVDGLLAIIVTGALWKIAGLWKPHEAATSEFSVHSPA